MPDLRVFRSRLAAAALCVALATPAAAFEELDALPEGPGREETFYSCIACHSFQVVTRQGMSRGMWEDTITLMVERHGMPELAPDEREVIIEYLAENFPASQPSGGTRRGWTNPFAR
jgi:hypothetical protein